MNNPDSYADFMIRRAEESGDVAGADHWRRVKADAEKAPPVVRRRKRRAPKSEKDPVTRKIVFVCNGSSGDCHQRLELTFGGNIVRAEAEARDRGWDVRASRQDFCPACVIAFQIPNDCPRCKFRTDFGDALGHDQLGHRATNALATAGIRSWDQLDAWSREALAKDTKLGGNSLALVLHIKEGRKVAGS
jgi:hypothetical protein